MPKGVYVRTKSTVRVLPKELRQRVRETHADKLEWKFPFLKRELVDRNSVITIRCAHHGDSTIKVMSVLAAQSGCKECGVRKPRKYSTQSFVHKAARVHKNKYDYSKTVFARIQDKLIVTCPKHGDWTPTAQNHLGGSGCPRCGKESTAKKLASGPQNNLKHTRRVHYGKYSFIVDSQAEEFALERLLDKYKPKMIQDQSDVPVIRYKYNGNNAYHRPDFAVKAANELFEIKSPVTMGLVWLSRTKRTGINAHETFERLKCKARYAEQKGYSYNVILVVGRGKHRQAYKLPVSWYVQNNTQAKVRKLLDLDFGEFNA